MQMQLTSPLLGTNRREWLLRSGALLAGCGMIGWSMLPVSAEPQVASRVDEPVPEHPLLPALKLVEESLRVLDPVVDYQATLIRQELVGRQMLSARMELKYRESPQSVYLKFIEPNAGREVLYRPDRYDGKMLVRDVGLASLVGTVQLDPKNKLALEQSRHSITAIGLRKMLTLLQEQWQAQTKFKDVTVNFYPNAKIGNLACKVIEVSHAQPQTGVLHQQTRLYLDPSSSLPVRIQKYAFPARRGGKPELVEDYFYQKLRTNPGLTDIDFDTRNPMYKF